MISAEQKLVLRNIALFLAAMSLAPLTASQLQPNAASNAFYDIS